MRLHSPKIFCLVIAFCVASSVLLGCRRQAVSGGQSLGAAERPLWRGVPQRNLIRECVADFNPATDYFPDKITPQYAQIFRVSYHGNYKVVRLAAQQTASENQPMSDVMVLTQCGTPAPRLEGELANAGVIEIPIRTIASNDNCDVAAICELGYGERLVAVGGREVYNDDIRPAWRRHRKFSLGETFSACQRCQRRVGSARRDLGYLSKEEFALLGGLNGNPNECARPGGR